MIIDTHCHLNFKAFKKDLDRVIADAQKADIGYIIIPGAKLDSSEKAIEIANKFPICHAAVGIHPHHVSLFMESGEKFIRNNLEKILQQEKVVALGEIGMDYHQYQGYPEISENLKIKQKELLLLQLELSNKYNLPVIFHCREAFEDMFTIIKDHLKIRTNRLKGVFHCFSGDTYDLDKVLDLGLYIGFNGNITYEENQNLRSLVKKTPSSKLLIETDAPFLSPIPYRGRRNEPAFITLTISAIAEITGKTQREIIKYSTENALDLFAL